MQKQLKYSLKEIGVIDDLNTPKSSVLIKPGIFNHTKKNHPTVETMGAIINCFNKSEKIFIAESDNYKGTGIERLEIYRKLFSSKVTPINLSKNIATDPVKIADEEMRLSNILFKPNIMVDTHILRSFEKGSVLKNLFGCIPTSKKMKYHKVLPELLADVYEAIGGVDLAVLDGTYFWRGVGTTPVRTNVLIVGRDVVAVESVGAILSGLKPMEMPVIQEFVERGLGEGCLDNIQIIGDFEDLKRDLESAQLKQKKLHRKSKGPRTWGGKMHRELQTLIKIGFFKTPRKRNLEQVINALHGKGLETKGKKDNISRALARRVKKGVLKRKKKNNRYIYWQS